MGTVLWQMRDLIAWVEYQRRKRTSIVVVVRPSENIRLSVGINLEEMHKSEDTRKNDNEYKSVPDMALPPKCHGRSVASTALKTAPRIPPQRNGNTEKHPANEGGSSREPFAICLP